MAIKELLIDTTFDPPKFSSDCTFKVTFTYTSFLIIFVKNSD